MIPCLGVTLVTAGSWGVRVSAGPRVCLCLSVSGDEGVKRVPLWWASSLM